MKTFELQKVDKNKIIPLYYQASQILEEIIKKGEVKPGEDKKRARREMREKKAGDWDKEKLSKNRNKD